MLANPGFVDVYSREGGLDDRYGIIGWGELYLEGEVDAELRRPCPAVRPPDEVRPGWWAEFGDVSNWRRSQSSARRFVTPIMSDRCLVSKSLSATMSSSPVDRAVAGSHPFAVVQQPVLHPAGLHGDLLV
jgi:hypothetical protein